jgi:hypothetical protein
MGPQDPKDVTRDVARGLSGVVGELASLTEDATHWLNDPEYATLRLRLEAAHAGCGGRRAGAGEAQAAAERRVGEVR